MYIGTALNLVYAKGREVKYVSACTLGREDKLAIANSGFCTEYAYTKSPITGSIIPTLQDFAANAPHSAQRWRALNQMSVLQQVVANNAANKAKARFVQASRSPYLPTILSTVSRYSPTNGRMVHSITALNL